MVVWARLPVCLLVRVCLIVLVRRCVLVAFKLLAYCSWLVLICCFAWVVVLVCLLLLGFRFLAGFVLIALLMVCL